MKIRRLTLSPFSCPDILPDEVGRRKQRRSRTNMSSWRDELSAAAKLTLTNVSWDIWSEMCRITPQESDTILRKNTSVSHDAQTHAARPERMPSYEPDQEQQRAFWPLWGSKGTDDSLKLHFISRAAASELLSVGFHVWPGKLKLSSFFKRSHRKALSVCNTKQRNRQITLYLSLRLSHFLFAWLTVIPVSAVVTKSLGKTKTWTKSDTLPLQ